MKVKGKRAKTARLVIPHAFLRPQIMTAPVGRVMGQSMRMEKLLLVVRIRMTLIAMGMDLAAKAKKNRE